MQNYIYGTDANDQLIGALDDDYIVGYSGDDSLEGHDGEDTLIGGAGSDTLWGGTGRDLASYQDAGSAVHIDLGLGLGFGGDAEGDVLVEIENVVGSQFADLLIGNETVNYLHGGLSAADTLMGMGGDDTLWAGPQGTLMIGGAGDDFLVLNGLEHTARGGAGDDSALVSNSQSEGAHLVFLGNGDDTATVMFSNGFDLIGHTTLDGGAGRDVLKLDLNAATRDLHLDLGRNEVHQLGSVQFSNFETYSIEMGSSSGYDLAGSVLKMGAGSDFVRLGGGDDLIVGRGGNDTLFGVLGDDTLRGGAGDDTLVMGLNGLGSMHGGSGDDVLVAGLYEGVPSYGPYHSHNFMAGGAGHDVFVFSDFRDSVRNPYDLIGDFARGEDAIALRFDGTAQAEILDRHFGAIDASNIVDSGLRLEFDVASENASVSYHKDTGELYWSDMRGWPGPTNKLICIVQGAPDLTLADFLGIG